MPESERLVGRDRYSLYLSFLCLRKGGRANFFSFAAILIIISPNWLPARSPNLDRRQGIKVSPAEIIYHPASGLAALKVMLNQQCIRVDACRRQRLGQFS